MGLQAASPLGWVGFAHVSWQRRKKFEKRKKSEESSVGGSMWVGIGPRSSSEKRRQKGDPQRTRPISKKFDRLRNGEWETEERDVRGLYAGIDATTVGGDGNAAADDVIDGNGGFSNESELSVTAAGLSVRSVRPRVLYSSWQD